MSGEDKDDVDGISTIPEPRKPLSETRGKSLGDMPNEEPLDLNQGMHSESSSVFFSCQILKLKLEEFHGCLLVHLCLFGEAIVHAWVNETIIP